MAAKNAMQQIGSLVSLPAGVLLAVMFFLPWVSMRCEVPPMMGNEGGEKELAVASGWELTVGELSPGGDMDDEEKLEEQQEEQGGEDSGPDARPWFALGIVAPLLLVVVGGLGLAGATPAKPLAGVMLLAALLGIAVVLLATTVDYGQEMAEDVEAQAEQSDDPNAQLQVQPSSKLAEAIKTEVKVWPWVSLALYVVVGLTGVALILLTPTPTPHYG